MNDEVYTAPAYSREGYLGAFVQDDWKLSRKLTVNVGLRWDLFIPDYSPVQSEVVDWYWGPEPRGPWRIRSFGFCHQLRRLRSGVYTHYHDFCPAHWAGLQFE